MRKQLIVLLLLGLVTSTVQAQQVFGTKKGEKPVVYRSFGSYVGEVGLQLFSNKKFELYFHDFDTGKTKTLKGKWVKRSKEIRLQFKGKPELDDLFARNLTLPSSTLKLLSDNEVQFETSDRGLFIWGIYCTKE